MKRDQREKLLMELQVDKIRREAIREYKASLEKKIKGWLTVIFVGLSAVLSLIALVRTF